MSTPVGPSTRPIQTEAPLQHASADKAKALLLDFKWKSCTATLIEEGAADAKPVYTVALKAFSKPSLRFKAPDGSDFGTGHAHLISINPDCTFNNKSLKLEALKRLKTAYTHQSQVLRTEDDKPAQLTWKTETDYLKTWTFICLDEVQQPVAKLEYNVWGVKKLGRIEFAEDRIVSEELRREMVVASVTLVYCMITRTNNIFNLVGSATHRKPKPEEKSGEAGNQALA